VILVEIQPYSSPTLDAAVRSCVDALGLKLTNCFGDSWATVEAGKGLTIGLHPLPRSIPPRTRGAIMLRLGIDESIDRVVARLSQSGVSMKGAVAREEAETELVHAGSKQKSSYR